MIYSFEYDGDYNNGPAMPMVQIQIRPVGKKEGGFSINAIVDSGADATILPLTLLQAANVERVGRATMRWGGHPGRSYDVFLAVIEIGSIQIPGIRVLASQMGDDPLIGRDVLNHLVVTLNGPANLVEIPLL